MSNIETEPYSVLAVRVLDLINRKCMETGKAMSTRLSEIATELNSEGSPIMEMTVGQALEEADKTGLITARSSREMGSTDTRYPSIKITGEGRRFLEALALQAKEEGKSRAWLWSWVERAVSLTQLVSTAAGVIAKASE